MKANKNFAVRVYDVTCNNYNHESGIYYDMSWVDGTIVDECSDYQLTKEDAESLKTEFESYAKKNNLDWARFEIEELELTFDVQFDDDSNSNSKGFEESYDYCKNYIKHNNGTNESYFADYKGGVVSIVCNETGEVVYSEEIK